MPKRYLKNAEWTKNGPLGMGYYIGDPDNKSKNLNIIPVDFNFKALQWGLTHKMTISSLKDQHQFNMDSESLMKKEPQIEAIGVPLMEHQTKKSLWKTNFKFGSDTGGDTHDPDITIPLDTQSQDEEFKLATLTQLIPSYISKPSPQPCLLAGAMAQIAATTTLTTNSLVAQTLGTGVSQRGTTSSAEGILQTIFPSQYN